MPLSLYYAVRQPLVEQALFVASELLHAGASLRQIPELLGHRHPDSSQRYTRVNAHELRGAIKRLRWVGG